MLKTIIQAIASAILGALANLWSQKRRDELAEAKGRAETEREQAREGERVQGELADEASKRVDSEDALAKLERGEA